MKEITGFRYIFSRQGCVPILFLYYILLHATQRQIFWRHLDLGAAGKT